MKGRHEDDLSLSGPIADTIGGDSHTDFPLIATLPAHVKRALAAMKKLPWIHLNVDEFHHETKHLTPTAGWAYTRLLLHYWVEHSLPADEEVIRRIAGLSKRDWLRNYSLIKGMFNTSGIHWCLHTWNHRIEQVLEISKANSANAKRSHCVRSALYNYRSKEEVSKSPLSKKIKGNPGNIDLPMDPSPSPPVSPPVATAPTPPQSHQPADPFLPPAAASDEADLFRRGKTVLGQNAGGLIARLLKLKGSVPKARAVVETASEKHNPREYIGAVLRGAKEEEDKIWRTPSLGAII